MPFEKELKELEERKARALLMGRAAKIRKQHDKGKLSARDRIDQLLDAGPFLEVGMFNHSDEPGAANPDDYRHLGRMLRHADLDGLFIGFCCAGERKRHGSFRPAGG